MFPFYFYSKRGYSQDIQMGIALLLCKSGGRRQQNSMPSHSKWRRSKSLPFKGLNIRHCNSNKKFKGLNIRLRGPKIGHNQCMFINALQKGRHLHPLHFKGIKITSKRTNINEVTFSFKIPAFQTKGPLFPNHRLNLPNNRIWCLEHSFSSTHDSYLSKVDVLEYKWLTRLCEDQRWDRGQRWQRQR